MSKTLSFCLCADDYAMTPGVSRGIIEALAAGGLSATSVMATSPWWPESAEALRLYASRVDIGLHLNLTLGAPLGPMPILAPEGRFPDVRALIRLARQNSLPVAEIDSEITRQYDRFSSVWGRAPDHVDGHQHVHVLPAIRQLILDALDRRGWRPWLRDSADRVDRLLRRACRRKALVLGLLGRSFATTAADRGFGTNRGFAGFSPFDPEQPYATLFETFLKAPGPRHLVMCHPGYVDDELRRLDPVLGTREQELRFITTALPSLLERKAAALERMSVLIGHTTSGG